MLGADTLPTPCRPPPVTLPAADGPAAADAVKASNKPQIEDDEIELWEIVKGQVKQHL